MASESRSLIVIGTISNGVVVPNSANNPQSVKQSPLVSAGAGQFDLAVASGIQEPTLLSVPTGALMARITVEGSGSIRRTSDGETTPTSSIGTLIPAGASWDDWGPLSAYQFFTATGACTLDVEYFK